MTQAQKMLTADTIDAALKPAVVDLLYRLADDALMIGHRNSEWTGIGPILEEDIAFSSMAQDKLGHALAFYNMLHELGEPDPDTLAYMREAEDFRCCALVTLSPAADIDTPDLRNNPTRNRLLTSGDWAVSFVRQYLYVRADVLRMAALESSAYEPIAAVARKVRGELKYHDMYVGSKLPRLARGNAESRDRMQAALSQLYPYALGMFEPSDYEVPLEKAGVAPRESSLCEDWTAGVAEDIADAGLSLPDNIEPVTGGRHGRHGPALRDLLADLQKVHRLAPGAVW